MSRVIPSRTGLGVGTRYRGCGTWFVLVLCPLLIPSHRLHADEWRLSENFPDTSVPPTESAIVTNPASTVAQTSPTPAVFIPPQDPPKAGPESSAPTPTAPTRVETAPALEKNQPLTVVEIQPWRERSELTIVGPQGSEGRAILTNLNPNINKWFVLKIVWPHTKASDTYHLENLDPDGQKIQLSNDFPDGIVIVDGKGSTHCPLWSSNTNYPIRTARFVKKPYAPLCDNRLYLRNRIEGYRTTKEWIVEFLRDKVWGGEAITSFVKETIYKDAFLLKSEAGAGKESKNLVSSSTSGPLPAALRPNQSDATVEPKELGLPLMEEMKGKPFKVGQWYPLKDTPGVMTSVIAPEFIHPDIMASYPEIVKRLDNIENTALSYLVAFDLEQFNVGFALGTDHPRVDWSERTLPELRDNRTPGPDGIGSIDPLVATGLLTPEATKSIVATFTSGFKRSHSAFRWGALAKVNKGSHYGFIENGVILSTLQPNLATIYMMKDGTVDMKTWTAADNSKLPLILHARQNGVAVIDYDESTGKSVPGKLVSNWTHGNWSGSQDMKFRTLRAGICLQESGTKKYLLYGYFSSVTPSAMARIFQAYHCKYGFHLDMNALEHTYLAVYRQDKELGPVPQHLIQGMSVLDERFKGNIPRFIGYPDNRDFFFLTRRQR